MPSQPEGRWCTIGKPSSGNGIKPATTPSAAGSRKRPSAPHALRLVPRPRNCLGGALGVTQNLARGPHHRLLDLFAEARWAPSQHQVLSIALIGDLAEGEAVVGRAVLLQRPPQRLKGACCTV